MAQDAGGEAAVELAPVVVESGARTDMPGFEITRSVTVVTEDEVQEQKRIDRSVGDILSKTVPGFSQSTEANTDFGQTLRGRTFQTLIDGVPQSTPLRDGRRSLNSIDADAIERIEVVRGGTALYGFGATGGLVNIVTKRPEDGEFNASGSAGIRLSATHPDDSLGYTGAAQLSGRTGQVDYLANASYVRRGGAFDAEGDRIPADPVGAQGGLSDSDTYNLLGKVGVEFDDSNQRLQFTALRYHMAQDSDWAGISFAGDPATGQKTPAVQGNFNPVNPGTDNTNLNLEYTVDSLWGSSLSTQLFYADLDVVYSKFPGFSQTRIESEKRGGRVTVNTPLNLGIETLNLTWGLDYLKDKTVQTATDGPDTSPALDQDAIAGFAQLEVPIQDIALISGGVRYEDIEVEVSDFTRANGTRVPGGTLTFGETLLNATGTLFVTDHIDIYGGFSQGFTLADIGRSIRDNTFATASEASSEAQKTNNYELGLRSQYERWDGSVVGFLSTSDNGTTFDRNLNIAKQPERIWGVELAVNVRPMEDLLVGGTFTWMRGRVDMDGDGSYEQDLPTTRIPPTKVTAFVEYSPFPWWLARLQALYSGNQDPNSTQFGGTGKIHDYVLFDLYSAFDVGPGQLQIGVENLLNADYTPVINQAYDVSYAYSRGPGTTVTAAYAVKF